jgi:vacuolar-type H+-ATPase subunit F/Vma7
VAATLFVDENLTRGFRLVGVVVTTGEIGRARATMRAQLPRGARRVHFVKENDARRRHVLRVIAGLRVGVVVVE